MTAPPCPPLRYPQRATFHPERVACGDTGPVRIQGSAAHPARVTLTHRALFRWLRPAELRELAWELAAFDRRTAR